MEELKQKRQVIKGSITRIYTFCNNPEASIDDIKARLSRLEVLFRDFENIQADIDALTSSADAEAEENYRSDIESKYYAIQSIFIARSRAEDANQTVIENQTPHPDMSASIQTLIDHQTTMSVLVERISANVLTANPSSTLQSSDSNSHNEIRLPHIQIPEFDGNYMNWLRFRDLFDAIIHKRQNLSGIEKFEYLQSRLKGDAISLIKHLTPSNDNYTIAWESLNNRYNKHDKIKRPYLDTLLSQPAMKSASASEAKRLYNCINESINALKALDEPVEQWDTMLLFMLEKKLDPESLTLWYRKRNGNECPTLSQFLSFMEQRVFELENTQSSVRQSATHSRPSHSQRSQQQAYSAMTSSCPACSENHPLYFCEKFKSLEVKDRQQLVRMNNLCFNCFEQNHRAADCKRSTCRKCGFKHNTLLHNSTSSNQSVSSEHKHESQKLENPNNSVSINSAHQGSSAVTLLPTAVVTVLDGNGAPQQCRALLDSGAQVTLITERCTQRLQLKKSYDTTQLFAVGSNTGSSTRGKVTLQLKASRSEMIVRTGAYCLSKLTQYLPGREVISNKLKYFENLDLADRAFNAPSAIDIILGADVFTQCILNEKIVHPSGSPTAMNTIFGWVIIGEIAFNQNTGSVTAHVTDISHQLKMFWEIEEVERSVKVLSEEEEQAEQHFKENIRRDSSGKYIARLPFKNDLIQFGDSKAAALRRLNKMETRFSSNHQLEIEYKKFMTEYVDLDHMELAEGPTQAKYFLPHHAVIKSSSTTTKLRVVFDASCKSTNGKSLNDYLLVGPTVQKDLFTILIQFRKFKIGFCGDIEKMYRQIIIDEHDRPYQRIVWREDTDNPPQEYNLKTVTYGTACAPFLATRTLLQVALDTEGIYPNAANAIKTCFYVDDFMSCTDDTHSAIQLKSEICKILSEAGFHLRKWCSNSQEFLSTINPEDRELAAETSIDDTQTTTVRTLGLLWDTTNDCFKYSVCVAETAKVVTKRIILSEISKVFDPLGWLSPVIISMKIFIQQLWLSGVDWDHPVPEELLNKLFNIRNSIHDISSVKIGRWLQYATQSHAELHGFSDASESAYSAAVYLKVRHQDSSISTNLVAAKTKVAPIKQITLPRLELCAAHMLAKLLKKLSETLEITQKQMFDYSDSTVVLEWIADHPRRWKTFVANRTSYITDIIPPRSVQQFRKKWSMERPKWKHKLQNLERDEVVIIKDDNQPPTQWQIGRIIDTHPGSDGLVRVVSVKTSRGILKRPIVKLCPLFVEI